MVLIVFQQNFKNTILSLRPDTKTWKTKELEAFQKYYIKFKTDVVERRDYPDPYFKNTILSLRHFWGLFLLAFLWYFKNTILSLRPISGV